MLSKDLMAATIRPAVLAILAQKESYGCEIIKEVIVLTNEQIEWGEGALYPLLHRLEREKLIESFWKVGDNGRRRKYYRLLAEGQTELAKEKERWTLASDLLNKLWGPEPCLN